MIQCFSGWGWVWIATLGGLLHAFPPGWTVSLSSRMLNGALKGILPWFRRLQQSRFVWLPVWWLAWRGIKLWCNPYAMDAPIGSLISVSERHISSQYARSKQLYTFSHWRRTQIACGGTWATWLTWILSICFTCRLFNLMLEVIVAATYRNLISVYSGCLKFCNGSCASLCIIDGARDWIVKNFLEINRTVQNTIWTIEIYRTNVKETRAMNWYSCLITVLKWGDDTITSLNASTDGWRLQISGSDYLWKM